METTAEHVKALNIESQPKTESKNENPIEILRRPTNRWFIYIVFIPLLVVWITSCFIGFSADYDSHDKESRNKYTEYINAPVTNISFMLPITLFVCTAEICICLLAGEKLSKFCVYASSVIMILYAFSTCLNALQYMLGNETTTLNDSIVTELQKINRDIGVIIPLIVLNIFIYSLPNFIFTITGIISFFKIDKKILCDITNYSCRSIVRSPPSLLFTALMTILKLLVYSIIFNSIIFKWLSKPSNDDTRVIYSIVIIIMGQSVVNVIDNYARMVISQYTIESFWAKNEQISITPIAWKVFRYHIGTAMFASTMIVSFFTSILQSFKHKPSWPMKESLIYVVTKFFLITSPDTVVIFTSIYGTSFFKSYQKTFDTVLRRCSTCMAMLMVLDGLLLLIFFILTFTVWMIIAKNVGSIYDVAFHPDTSRIIYGFLYSYLAFELLISSTVKAQLINKIIVLNREDHDEEINVNQNR